MPTKQAIITAIREGIEQVELTFGALTEEQLDTQVHAGDGGWTGRQVLAHLAGRSSTHQMIFQMVGAPPPDPAAAGGFDVNHWNQEIVDARAGASRDELLSEFRETHEQLIERVETLGDSDFDQTVTTPRGVSTVGEVLMNSGGKHSVSHAEEVKSAQA